MKLIAAQARVRREFIEVRLFDCRASMNRLIFATRS
jgi:hypothetical protein